ncbi:hypothetical protein QVD17_18917 [Tagetes erecta]|uniref:Uncharacterized protein n=1 Tax=Tagetes erecta TaxID=13708 RepID=A0AAD8KNQ6_TARER|nr:hypothetical protein QVD17_18917 [Tagetes erecta]
MKMLHAKAVSVNRNEILVPAVSPADDVVNKEDVSPEFHPDQNGGEGRLGRVSCEQREHGVLHTVESSFFEGKTLSEISDDFNEVLDHVSLKERRKMLLSRERARFIRPAMKHNPTDPSTNPVGKILHNSGLGRDICGIRTTIGKKFSFEKGDTNISSSKVSKPRSLNRIAAGAPTWTSQHEGSTLTKSKFFKNAYKEVRPCSPIRSFGNKNHLFSSSCKDVGTLALKPLPNVKVETLDDDIEIPNRSIGNQICEKEEPVNTSENLEDIIDHMMLGDRMRLLASRKFPKTIAYDKFETANNYKSKLSKSSTPSVIKLPRKRRRTVTDSVETALEEDAPGLLKVLIEKGVLVDEIKLYGANEGDEPVDESMVEESFSDLEDVITKIFSQQQSLFKFAPIRCGRGEKTTYCLACLISLVEQARYLRVRKWPVEWGWCRDLQSFIFVFNKHNRIVLERPEYGYATYFFELVDALPVHWQIKRLVTAMKLTSCTRITLIENRALMVGKDLSEE